jgi:hypothetical protein
MSSAKTNETEGLKMLAAAWQRRAAKLKTPDAAPGTDLEWLKQHEEVTMAAIYEFCAAQLLDQIAGTSEHMDRLEAIGRHILGERREDIT